MSVIPFHFAVAVDVGTRQVGDRVQALLWRRIVQRIAENSRGIGRRSSLGWTDEASGSRIAGSKVGRPDEGASHVGVRKAKRGTGPVLRDTAIGRAAARCPQTHS